MDSTAPTSPPQSPGPNATSTKTASRPQSAAGNFGMPRAKRSSSRATEGHGHVSRRSEEDMKTAVKVAVRVRPPLKSSDAGFDLIPQRFRESTCDVPTPTNLAIQSPQGKKLFVFDRVFDEGISQGGVWDYLSESVTAFVKGYNVSVLAYGQSGAGKSYTMGTSGPSDQSDPEVMGIIPRAAQALFEQLNGSIAAKPASGIQHPKRYSTQNVPHLAPGKGAGNKNWELKATYMEIYNEQLRDLLVPENTPHGERQQVSIREDTKGRILLTGLTQITINSVEDLLQALNFGSSIRQTDETAINARSSRSHAVFSLNLVQKKPEPLSSPMSKAEKRKSMPVDAMSSDNTVTVDSKLHFVDLAGSERLKNTNAKGDRAKEGISINAGLASLGKVISQLSSKNAHTHISYRDSRLTRLLQDSLGGNAFTYMVACVTPAAFHLSETLNTVHYAQRARAIQSKPEIQTSYEDGDKQAIIDRLRAEVSFLRDQVRNPETSDRKGPTGSERNQARGRDELEHQLLDMQENYNALSARHTKLVSDLSKAREDDAADGPELRGAISDNALERVKRSSSFAEAVEQMVVEYEKTIQSLEASLSKTRSTLASAESNIVEKDTHINYLETLQHQLETRVQKAMDREQNAENYLRNLESKIEGATSDEERTATLIAELRKELERLREGETSAEEYISTLEERLAEAEQDQETMQREIDRLEHVVERQRSIGRLDNILGELDTSQQHPSAPAVQKPKTNGHRYQESYDPFRPNDEAASISSADEGDDESVAPSKISTHSVHEIGHSPAQNDFMADKVENLTQELFDLRSEHEANIVDYENLQQKYRTALETLAKVEYQRETKDSRSEPRDSGHASFLADAGMRGEEKAEQREQPSSSRSLSADLSSPGPLSITGEDDKEPRGSETGETTVTEDTLVQPDEVPITPETPVSMQAEMDMLHKLHSEKDVSLTELTNTYKSLATRHESTLRQVENLKREIQMNQLRPNSPSLVKPKSNRRKSEDLLGIGTERVTRSLNSLKAIAFDHFDSTPDVRQNFELSLNAVMNELNSRSERVAALEVELTAVRKEMEGKSAIIAGLTRERSSLRASSPVDFSVVGQMRDQLMESESQIRALHEQHAAREKELNEEVASLKASVESHKNAIVPGGFPQTPAEPESSRELGKTQAVPGAEQDKEEISRLQSELAAWETKHATTLSSMKASETNLLKTISELESSLRNSASNRGVPSEVEEERAKHSKLVDALQTELQDYKSTAKTHQAKFTELEQSYASILQQVDEDSKSKELSANELKTHKDLVSNLEAQLKEHQAAVRNHQTTLDLLQGTHDKELDLLKSSLKYNEEEHRKKQADMTEHHDLVVQNMHADLTRAQTELDEFQKNATLGLGYKTDSKSVKDHIKGLVEEGKEVHTRHLKTTDELKTMQEELQNALTKTVDLESKVNELKLINDEMIVELEKVTGREKKSARLVEDLEEQLNSTFDRQKATTKRMSAMHAEAVEARVALERELEEQKMKNNSLESQIVAMQRQSIASNASNFNHDTLSPEAAAFALARSGADPSQAAATQRKSVGGSVLPTAPPSIPLPPLPGTPSANAPAGTGLRSGSPIDQRPSSASHNHSPPGSRHNSKESPAIGQLVEEQEARIRTIEKHLFAEKQLTATLEEALVDLETSANRTKADMENWRKKCGTLEDEIVTLRKDKTNQRASLQAVEEEREMRVRAEKARQALEQRMAELNAGKKKKKNALNCF